MRVLMIDNYDSFTYNLVQYLQELGAEVLVHRNDQITIEEIEALNPDRLMISPGPCTPNEAGISIAAIQHFAGKLPILGVCLGHQAIGQVFGADVVGAQEIKHGKVSTLKHKQTGLFKTLPKAFNVTRYHSLVLNPTTMPRSLQVDAWCETAQGRKEIMAISHTQHPIWGVQYHPESLLTEHGHSVLDAFLRFKMP